MVRNASDAILDAHRATIGVGLTDEDADHLAWWLLDRLTIPGARRLATEAGMAGNTMVKRSMLWDRRLYGREPEAARGTAAAVINWRRIFNMTEAETSLVPTKAIVDSQQQFEAVRAEAIKDGPRSRKYAPPNMVIDCSLIACGMGVADRGELASQRRRPDVVRAREVVILMLRQYTPMSYPEIAMAIGRPNHSTIITAHKRAMDKLKNGAGDMLDFCQAVAVARGMIEQLVMEAA